MGLLSLFSTRKGTDPAPERGARRTRAESGAGIGASRRQADEYADDTLDPDFPQKQRARRRLIGAVVLLAAAVIVLPIVFEHKPRPVSDDVAVSVANGQGAQKPKVEARKAQALPPSANASRNDAALDAGEEIVNAPAADKPKADAKPEVKADTKVAEARPAEKPADKPADKPAAANTKYLILIGAFSSEERAKNWLAKLKESKVPAFVEKKTLADGDRILLRAGPFASRDAADAADRKVRSIGLTSRVVEQ
ncbi:MULTISPECIES: SPOR domain-containing protein [unclassified Cupriavidus]|jgi:DedD protein|uniref:SPOR domain-containing protein n=1 Tax=unclassified Cupriavidus TaxID=2640874 RepID=UPI001C002746|nr:MULTISPECIES: SPOR domain-containing protein [unclassified Cupriavidus]MCA3183878.1 SPOR domain-containing protein [Cupriavidus sp.]MCA3191037.1 SPOR domain-containing protein [Cupriavidus sp.]MCA3199381.1 SPOR domain-containing protein [Cupriavidus sp.]MCA3204648.1 SPOR domain-containing protein [Cupriavidus sp.]MCA3208895.1 SPOR domain-containing protein [Cupriavidus sp.]